MALWDLLRWALLCAALLSGWDGAEGQVNLAGIDLGRLRSVTAAPVSLNQQPSGTTKDPLEDLGRSFASQGILSNLFNYFQQGVKTAIDQLVPNVRIPAVLPASVPDLTLGEVRLPNVLGGSRLLPSACPLCQNLDPRQLVGVWTLVYANDNFLKSRLSVLGKLATQLSAQDPSRPAQPSTLNTIQNLFNPIRYPVCVRLQVGLPRSFGFLVDFPVLLSLREGRPNGPLRSLAGTLRQVDEGRYVLLLAGGRLLIRLCAVASNLFTPLYPPDVLTNVQDRRPDVRPPPASLSQRRASSNSTSSNNSSSAEQKAPKLLRQPPRPPKYFALSDTSGFPGCQNYLVLADSPTSFLSTYDPIVTKYLRRLGADSDANPLHYVPCPKSPLEP